MRQVVWASLSVLAGGWVQPVYAQLEDQPVLMHEAPFHIPVFSNEHIILLNVNIPPGRNTGFHTHYADSAAVNLTGALRTDQIHGSSVVSRADPGDGVPGRVFFTNVTKDGPRTHRVSNVGPTPFHNISFILREAGPSGSEVSDRSGAAGYTQVMDNERLRAWRVVLEPGETTGRITQSAPGLRIYVRGGVLDELVPGAADRGMAPYDGDFIWQPAGQTRAVRNTGSTRLEFLEFELK